MSQAAAVPPAPFSLSLLLQQSVNVYRAQWLKIMACIALTQIPAACLVLGQLLYVIPQMTAVQQNPVVSPSNPQAMQRLMAQSLNASLLSLAFPCALLLVQLAILPISQGAATAIVSGHVLGKPTAFVDAFRQSLAAWPRTALVFLVSFILIFIGVFWAIVPCFGWLTGFGAITVFGVVLAMAIPIAMLEKKGLNSIPRAWHLLRKNWVMIGVVLLVGLLTGVIGFLSGVLVPAAFNFVDSQSLSMTLPTTSPYYTISAVVQSIISLALGLIVGSMQMVLIVMAYFDLRTRYEGLDLGKIQAVENSSERTLPDSPETPSGNWITWTEAGYIVGISVALIALYACLYGIIFLSVLSQMPARGF